jgi:hypothetical protein
MDESTTVPYSQEPHTAAGYLDAQGRGRPPTPPRSPLAMVLPVELCCVQCHAASSSPLPAELRSVTPCRGSAELAAHAVSPLASGGWGGDGRRRTLGKLGGARAEQKSRRQHSAGVEGTLAGALDGHEGGPALRGGRRWGAAGGPVGVVWQHSGGPRGTRPAAMAGVGG